ncbi:MAG: hypothetical protein AWL62_2947, partial [Halanaerobium sp. T82-1]
STSTQEVDFCFYDIFQQQVVSKESNY